MSNNYTELAKQLYPDITYGAYDYSPMIDYFGTVLVRKDIGDGYSGDTMVLLEKDGIYGYLCLGWGSCSGCDALQACRTYEHIADLIQETELQVKWALRNDMVQFLKTHDWAGDFTWNSTDRDAFLDECLRVLAEVEI